MNKNYKYKPACYRNGFRWRVGFNSTYMENRRLYHYTSMCNALKILSTGVLFFSELKRSNDMNERIRMAFDNNFGVDVEKELSFYRQLSFSMDGKRPGYTIPAMWGHYGDSGKGVCFVFDMATILANRPKNTHSGEIKYEGEYYADADSSIVCDSDDAKEYFAKHINELFFIKTADWEYEQEFRIVVRSDIECLPIKLPLKKALRAAIIFVPESTHGDMCVFNSSDYLALKSLLPDVPVPALGKFLGDKATLVTEDGYECYFDDNVQFKQKYTNLSFHKCF